MKIPENAPTREQIADKIAQLERMHPLDGLVPWTTAPIDLLPMLRLALYGLDCKEASGEGLDVKRVLQLASQLGVPEDRAVALVTAIAPLLSAAARRKALEEAEALLRLRAVSRTTLTSLDRALSQESEDAATALRALGRPA